MAGWVLVLVLVLVGRKKKPPKRRSLGGLGGFEVWFGSGNDAHLLFPFHDLALGLSDTFAPPGVEVLADSQKLFRVDLFGQHTLPIQSAV